MRAGPEGEVKRLGDNPALVPTILGVLIVAGAIVRWIVAGQDLFADELATYWVVSAHGFGGVIDTVSSTAEITPPLGFLLTWLSTQVDQAPHFVRMPAFIAGVATIPIVYGIGLRTVGRGAALTAAALVTVSPFMVFYSTEARGYGLMMAFVTTSTLALLLAIDRGKWGWWVLYGVAILAAAYTHYTSVFVLAAQFTWAAWVHPKARKPLLISTAIAIVLYLPWASGLKGDLDSPTTDILSALSPFDATSIRMYLGHWTVGFPFGTVASLDQLPGPGGLLLIGAGLAVGAVGLVSMRGRLRAWFAVAHNRIALVALLAVVTPAVEALQSLVSTNTFSTRNFAASWPYLALTVAALVTVGDRRLRIAAASLLVVGLSFGSVKMLSADYSRPPFSDVAAYVADGPGGVVVDDASLSPGPLTNFDVSGSDPGGEVFRLNYSPEKTRPFRIGDAPPDPKILAKEAAQAADGGPITVVTAITPTAVGAEQANVQEFVAALPAGYELTATKTFNGFFDLVAQTYEQTG